MKVALGVLAGLLTFVLAGAGVLLAQSAELDEPTRAYTLEAEVWAAGTGWRPAGKLDAQRDDHRAVRVGERVVVVGGSERDQAAVWSNGRWSSEPLPQLARNQGLLLSTGAEAIALGGWDDDRARQANIARRSADGRWAVSQGPLEKVVAAQVLADGRVVALDGDGNTAVQQGGGWSALGRAGGGVGGVYGGSALLPGERVLVLNRYAYGDFAVAQVLDVADGGWADVPELKDPLIGTSSGARLEAPLPLSTGELAIVTSGQGCPTWSPTAHTVTPHPCPLEGDLGDALWAPIGGDAWLVIDGEQAVVWLPLTGATKPTAMPATPRTHATLTALGEGRALLAGGGNLASQISAPGVTSLIIGVLTTLATLVFAVIVFRRPSFTRPARIGFFIGVAVGGCAAGAVVMMLQAIAGAIKG